MRQKLILAIAATFCVLTGTYSAEATQILAFGQAMQGNTITATETGGNSTTITGTNVPITITQLDALPTPISAFFTLDATSVGVATMIGINATENFNGSFTITSGPGGSGTNYLSGTFSDAVFGNGGSLTLQASQPGESVSFTSGVVANLLGPPEALGLAFADVTPLLSISGTSIASFTSSVSGTFSATTPVPEPASLSILGVALVGLGLLRRRRQEKQ